MTFSEFLAFLHECGLDVVLLGLLDGLVCALAERLPEKYGKPLSSRLRAALPFLLGVGMALPWPLAGAGLAVLPKPGRFMIAVKYLFGAVILAAAVFYGVTGWRLLPGSYSPEAEVERRGMKSWSTARPFVRERNSSASRVRSMPSYRMRSSTV